MRNKLEVWFLLHHVGTLELIGGHLRFQYASTWLTHQEATALSCFLPLQTEYFDDPICRPFFAGLLPEGELRRLIAKQCHISAHNDFALLDYIGGECAGAVSFLKTGKTPSSLKSDGDIEWLSDPQLLALLKELPRRPMLAGKAGLRLSLAGAQDKLPVFIKNGRIGLPRNGTPSSHILKPSIPDVEDSVINEAFCLALAHKMQLNVAIAHIGKIDHHTFLLVERYDRTINTQGHLERLHQEDFCQALGIIPELKYQNEGGPDLKQCFELVRRIMRPSAPQVLELLNYVVFNALIGNNDAHAKNFSILYNHKSPGLAPLYDALSTAIYPELSSKMAMKLGSKYKFNEVQARHWDQFAKITSLSLPQTRKHILNLAQQLPTAARELQSLSTNEFNRSILVEKIIKLIEHRCALTTHLLSTTPIPE
jgi:serine/threonine-protein kinase HipA